MILPNHNPHKTELGERQGFMRYYNASIIKGLQNVLLVYSAVRRILKHPPKVQYCNSTL